MPQGKLNFIKGDKVSSKVDYRDALPKNVSGVVRPIYDVQGYMLQQPGLTLLGDAVGIDRGGLWNERLEKHFRLSGTQFIELNADGTYVPRGEIPNTDTASMPYSFNTQAIIADGDYYLYDSVNGLRQIFDEDLGNPIDAVWVDGYYFFTDGENLYHTLINDEEQIDPLQFATSEFSPDPTVGVGKTTDNKVIAFNRYSVEYFVNQANEDFAFSRLPTRAIKYGLVGTHCKCEIGGQFFFMGGPKEASVSVYALGVGNAPEIASREVTKLIANYTEEELSTSVLEPRVVDGISYLILHLPNESLLYNFEVAALSGHDMAWSILTSSVETNAVWRGKHGAFDPRLGKWIYGDKTTSRLGILDDSVATQYGEKIECAIFSPFTYLESASIDEISIDTIPGFNAEPDATVFLSLTYDGNFYSNEAILDYSDPSDYTKRFMAYRLGYVEDNFSMRLRWVSQSRMCFSRAVFNYG